MSIQFAGVTAAKLGSQTIDEIYCQNQRLWPATVPSPLVPPPIVRKLPDDPFNFQRERISVKEGTYVTLLYPDHPASYVNEPVAGVYGWRHLGFVGISSSHQYLELDGRVSFAPNPPLRASTTPNLTLSGFPTKGFDVHYVDLDKDRHTDITFYLTKKLGAGVYVIPTNNNWGEDFDLNTQFHYFFEFT